MLPIPPFRRTISTTIEELRVKILTQSQTGRKFGRFFLKGHRWVFPQIGVFPNHEFNRVFRYKPSILGYPYSWKHPDLFVDFVVFILHI